MCGDTKIFRMIPILHFPSRLQQLYDQQNEEKKQKLKTWEIWIVRIHELEKKCQGKLDNLKSKGEPEGKKEVKDQIILAKVS